MLNKILHIGLIGAGRIGKMHAENIANNFPGVKLKSVADPSIDKKWIESLNIENCYANPDKIINDDTELAETFNNFFTVHASLILFARYYGTLGAFSFWYCNWVSITYPYGGPGTLFSRIERLLNVL